MGEHSAHYSHGSGQVEGQVLEMAGGEHVAYTAASEPPSHPVHGADQVAAHPVGPAEGEYVGNPTPADHHGHLGGLSDGEHVGHPVATDHPAHYDHCAGQVAVHVELAGVGHFGH